ncbi:MAG: hypothetical protein V3W28_03685 [Thermoplasmata archaeon]
MSLLDQLPDRCTIRRRSRTKGGLAGSKTNTADEQTGVECWDQSASASEVSRYNKRGVLVSHKVYFTTDPGVTERHQIVVTSRGGTAVAAASQVPLDVKAIDDPDASAGLGVVFKVMCDYDQGRED